MSDIVKITEGLIKAVQATQGVHQHTPIDASYYDEDRDMGVYMKVCENCQSVYNDLEDIWEPIDV